MQLMNRSLKYRWSLVEAEGGDKMSNLIYMAYSNGQPPTPFILNDAPATFQ